MMSHQLAGLIVVAKDESEFGFTKPQRIGEDGLKYRFQRAGRAGNDAQDLRGRSLLLQRFGKMPLRLIAFAGALFEFFFEIGGRGSAGAPGRLLAAVGPCCLFAPRFHGSAACCAASAINAIDATIGLRFIRPSRRITPVAENIPCRGWEWTGPEGVPSQAHR
jgi:hypothetical protein